MALDFETIANLRGPAGRDGSNVLPTDEAMAQTAADPQSEFATQLSATIAAGSEAATVDALGDRQSEARKILARIVPSRMLSQFGGLIRSLAGRRSASFLFTGDSTGDSDGAVAANDRTAARFARRLAQAFPFAHVIMRTWNPISEDFGAWVTVAAQAAGRLHAKITTRALRHVSSVTLTSLDLAVLVATDAWPTSTVSLLSRQKKETNTNELQFEFSILASGALRVRWSSNGTGWNVGDRTSTATLPAAGQPIWLRVTAALTAGTGSEVKFYTSSDGETWTQLGATVTNADSGAMFQSTAGAFFSLGAGGWQPTFEGFNGGRIYEVRIRDGINGPLVAPAAIEQWERYTDASTTFGGAPTLYVINASRSGSRLEYHTDPVRLRKETPDYGQSLVIFNNGHNEQARNGSTWVPLMEAWVAAVLGRLPNAAVALIGQNPHAPWFSSYTTQTPEHVTRIFELSALAARKGWAFVNAYQAYLDDPRGLEALISADGLHPTAAGYALSGDTVADAAGIAS